jgi:hypothetical protein
VCKLLCNLIRTSCTFCGFDECSLHTYPSENVQGVTFRLGVRLRHRQAQRLRKSRHGETQPSVKTLEAVPVSDGHGQRWLECSQNAVIPSRIASRCES